MLVLNNPNAVQAGKIERETFEFNYFEIVSKVRDFATQFKSNLSSEPHDYQNSGHSSTEKLIQSDKDPKTLGPLWNPTLDQLKYSVQKPSQQRTTKRKILSTIAQIFDPLGLVDRLSLKPR